MLQPNYVESIKSKLLLNKVVVNDCWLWKGKYGRQWIGIDYKTYLVHRVSASIFLGMDLDSHELVCHKLICPNPGCYNPDHIYIGDTSTNTIDVVKSGKYRNGNTNKTVCKCGKPYDSYTIRANGKIWRICKSCKNESNRKLRRKNNAST